MSDLKERYQNWLIVVSAILFLVTVAFGGFLGINRFLQVEPSAKNSVYFLSMLVPLIAILAGVGLSIGMGILASPRPSKRYDEKISQIEDRMHEEYVIGFLKPDRRSIG